MRVLDESKMIVERERARVVREFPELAPLMSRLEIVWKPRMTKVAGVAREFSSGRREVILSQFFFSQIENVKHVADTFNHELAHLVVGNRHGHDDVWKAAATRIGGPGAATQFHCMQGKSKPQRRWRARCSHCEKILEVTTVRANKMRRGFKYHHVDCGASPLQSLVLLERPD